MQSTGLHGLKSFYIIHKRKLQRDAIYGIAWIEIYCLCPFPHLHLDAIYRIVWIGIIWNNITSLNVNIENRKMSEKIIKIPVYTINLRLYPNKEQKK